MDFAGMMRGYRALFGTPAQPNKPARSTMQVAGLVDPGWLVEIEVTAADGAAALGSIGGAGDGDTAAIPRRDGTGRRRQRGLSVDAGDGPAGDAARLRRRRPTLAAGTGQGKSVVILGAGIAGLVAAYELQQGRLGGHRARGARPHRRAGVDGARRRPHRPDRAPRPAQRLMTTASISTPARRASRRTITPSSAMRASSKVPIEVMVNVNRSAGMDFGGRGARAPGGQRRARALRRTAGEGDRQGRARRRTDRRR